MLNTDHPLRTNMKINVNDKVAVCRCWKSKSFPYCDGSHREYNATFDDNVGPIIIEVEKEK